ncbi:hypothetical protein [Marinitenerispora sediminis]|uniref:Uncharacterized protein n=1 Tax=Marinitenerispora sediminis TaxID=1931232 RepID=A0A368T9E4_9ACTN|nr:hypothetical protein [Marinitenerispora sediminis]RCV54601.1 hypothetical protein DEF28_07880 [Marinitenerispora sediminis]RCV59844.1 hypothetical protein DEF23_06185 [Marinitenerispora sediminis]RCV61171.1 hypothetical protein DEF24_04895 [Marinitenerispora sediminis]
MSLERIRSELALQDAMAAMCLAHRPQLYALAGMDYAEHDGAILGWLLAWSDQVVVYRFDRINVTAYPSIAEFQAAHEKRFRSRELTLVAMDGQPTPSLN